MSDVGRGTRPESPPAPGWYPDPWSATGTGERYFDGKRWGTTERPMGRHTVTPAAEKTRKTQRSDGGAEPPSRRRSVRSIAIVAVVLVGGYWIVAQQGRSGSPRVGPRKP